MKPRPFHKHPPTLFSFCPASDLQAARGHARWAWSYGRSSEIPPTVTPPLLPRRNLALLFKDYVYVSPPYVALRHQYKAGGRDFLSRMLTASEKSRKR